MRSASEREQGKGFQAPSVRGSCQDPADRFAGDVGQAEITAGMAIGEAFVVEAHEVKDRGVEIVDMDGIAPHADAMVVRLAIHGSGPDAGSCHP